MCEEPMVVDESMEEPMEWEQSLDISMDDEDMVEDCELVEQPIRVEVTFQNMNPVADGTERYWDSPGTPNLKGAYTVQVRDRTSQISVVVDEGTMLLSLDARTLKQ